jgi:hypothetical protein
MYTKQVGKVRYNTLGGPKENLTNFSPSSTRAKKKSTYAQGPNKLTGRRDQPQPDQRNR